MSLTVTPPESRPHGYIFPEYLDVLRYRLKRSHPIGLTGPTGSGKTSMIYALRDSYFPSTRIIRVNLNGMVTPSDFVGGFIARDGSTQYVYGALPLAMIHGHWLIVDEIDYGMPEILGLLNAVLEPGTSLFLKENNNEEIKPHPDFRIFCTGNTLGGQSKYRPLYQGTVPMNEAFLNRWSLFTVDYLPPDKEAELITEKMRVPLPVTKKMVDLASSIRRGFQEGEISCTFSTRVLLDWAEMVTLFSKEGKTALIKGLEYSLLPKVIDSDRSKILELANKIFDINS